jgi:hypothetical protein
VKKDERRAINKEKYPHSNTFEYDHYDQPKFHTYPTVHRGNFTSMDNDKNHQQYQRRLEERKRTFDGNRQKIPKESKEDRLKREEEARKLAH